ncbi:phosphatase PAP2 family protein, partial [Verrucomicrobium sp. BvORR106]|uniref:phosphatase PAP2 family protein n=1 Tax=Verrucomicrobium sp. BvORR106 TaxID=1403819 RepID=UPI0022410031
YHFGTLPAMLAVLVALGGLVLKVGRRLPAERNFATVYLALVLAVGPGLVANAILKDHWGRPRPRDVVEFGGRHAYEPVWVRDASSTGKSFPCGHATMGFFFFSYYFIHRRRNVQLAWAGLAGGMVTGWLIGLARAVQGGHFLTDTWWAMGLMWFTCAGLWTGTQVLERRQWFARGFAWLLKHPRSGAAIVALLIALATVGALLATPYQRNQMVEGPDVVPDGGLRLSGTFQEGNLEIVPAAVPRLKVDASGHGMVWSVVLSGVRLKQSTGAGLPEVRYVQTRKGWFTELNQELQLEFPVESVREAVLTLAGTEVTLNPGPVLDRQEWKFTGEGTVELLVPEGCEVVVAHGPTVTVTDDTGEFHQGEGRWSRQGKGPRLRLLMALERGQVRLVSRGAVQKR